MRHCHTRPARGPRHGLRFGAALSLLTLVLPALAAAQGGAGAPPRATHASSAEAQEWVRQHLASWPASVQKLAEQLVAEYGLPGESSNSQITWRDNVPFKRTVLHREGPRHNFPLPHQDILEQTVSYRVPPDKLADLANYDGSLVVDRTRGELTVHCDSEEQNRLTLNIADDIVKGERTLDQALAYHAQVVRGLQIHEPETYPRQLRFKPQPSAVTADPGEEAELLRHLANPG